jgi:Fusaric acid resistance protein family
LAFSSGCRFWGGACGLLATLLRNFAAYSAALAVYTALIIASDEFGATGGANGDAFMLAITRASEICIGIVCAGVVLARIDFGGARRRSSSPSLPPKSLEDLSLHFHLPDGNCRKRARFSACAGYVALRPIAAPAYPNDSLIRLQRVRIPYRVVGVGAAEGVTITVAVKPAASVIVGGTLSILIRTGIRWASRTQV